MTDNRKEYGGGWAILALFALPWIFYFPAWLRPMAYGDNLVEMWHTAKFAFDALRQGRDPLWNPFICSGFPVAGYSNTGMYSITNLPHLVLPHVWALTIQIMLVHSLAGIGLYLFARRIGSSVEGALVGGAIFSFCGFMLGGREYTYFMAGATGIGFVLWGIERMRSSDSTTALVRHTLVASLLLALQLLAGHPQQTVISGLLYGIYILWFSFPRRGRVNLRLLAGGAVVVVVAISLTACLWIPAIELLRYSSREYISYERFVVLSVAPHKIMANLFLLRMGPFREYSFWLGIPAALLAWRGLSSEWRRPVVKFLLLSAIISAIMGLGKYTPLYNLLYHVPVFNRLTAPVRYSLDFCFAISCLAALGWDSFRKIPVGLLVSRREFSVFALVILSSAALLWKDDFGAIARIAPDIIAGALAVMLAARWVKSGMSSRVAAPVFIALIMFPPWFVAGGSRAAGTDPRPQREPHWAKVEESIVGDPTARILDFVDLRLTMGEIVRHLPAHNLNMAIGWSDAAGYQPLILDRYARLLESDFTGVIGHPENLFDARNRALDILNVKCLLLPSSYMRGPESILRHITGWKHFLASSGGAAFGENLKLRIDASQTVKFRAPQFMGAVNGVALVSGMGFASGVRQNEEVAEIVLTDENDSRRVLKMRAGIETAETMYPKMDGKLFKMRDGVPFFSPINMPLWAGLDHEFFFHNIMVSKIALLTYLYNAEAVEQNTPVATIEVVGDKGTIRTYALRAGIDTAQWTAGAGNSMIAHQPAKKAEDIEAGGVKGNIYILSIDVEPPIKSSSLRIKCLLGEKNSGIYLSHITLMDQLGKFSPVVSGGVAHDMPASALPSSGGNGFSYFAKLAFEPISPKQIEIKWLAPELTKTFLSIIAMTFLQNGKPWPVHPVDVALGNQKRFDILREDDLAVVVSNKRALPRAWLTYDWITLSPDEIYKAITEGVLPGGADFDPPRTALVERSLPPPPMSRSENWSRAPKVSFEEYTANRIRLSVNTPEQGLLVLSEIYYPGWETAVDGKPVTTIQVDYILRGAMIPPGAHEVVMRFRPASVRKGRLISVATLSLVLIALAACAFKRRGLAM